MTDVDALYERAIRMGLTPAAPPRDAEWGERYFHLTDPDGHEASFRSSCSAWIVKSRFTFSVFA